MSGTLADYKAAVAAYVEILEQVRADLTAAVARAERAEAACQTMSDAWDRFIENDDMEAAIAGIVAVRDALVAERDR